MRNVLSFFCVAEEMIKKAVEVGVETGDLRVGSVCTDAFEFR